jgi:endonuclease/exonuclease/phosphatase family metal-dependent hydrolase
VTISVLQWNVSFGENIRHVVEFLQTINADVVCLQELAINYPKQPVENTPPYLAKCLGYNYFAKDILLRKDADGRVVRIANGVFTRFPVVSTRSVRINERAGENKYRAYVEITVNAAGHEFTVGTTHLLFTPGFKSTPRTKAEADDLVKTISSHRESFIFTGDLNATPDSYTIKAVSQHLKNAGPDVSQKTWTTKPFSYQGFEETELNWRLDYVFTTPDIQVLSSKILQTAYSDHLPILTKMKIS